MKSFFTKLRQCHLRNFIGSTYKKMNYIVGDIGNTTTRICLLNKNYKINQSVIIDTKKIFIKGYIKNIFKNY